MLPGDCRITSAGKMYVRVTLADGAAPSMKAAARTAVVSSM